MTIRRKKEGGVVKGSGPLRFSLPQDSVMSVRVYQRLKDGTSKLKWEGTSTITRKLTYTQLALRMIKAIFEDKPRN